VLLALAAPLSACGDGDGDGEEPGPWEATMAMVVTSPAFGEGETIPQRFTCDGEDVSPPLEFGQVPEGTAELAVLVEDPDAPGGAFVHWVMWGLDPARTGLTEGEVPAGASQGRNDFGRPGYGGPCPPAGPAHRYSFTVLALAEPLRLAAGASADELRDAAADSLLATGALTGRYGR
jgi:Raf kinase inhibitor-like YbhB/YbcL family protein